MSFIELYNRSGELIEMLNEYRATEGKSLGALLLAYRQDRLAEEIGAVTEIPDPGPGGGGGTGGEVDPEAVKRLNELIERAERAVGPVEFPSRRLGPSVTGDYHPHADWGIHFEAPRALHLGHATVDAERAGTMTVVLAKYDGGEKHDPVVTKDIDVKQGTNRVNLDIEIPEAGEYLLSRSGDLPLRRGEWAGWLTQSRDGLKLKGGSMPTASSRPNQFWYYFFDLNVAAHNEAHLPEPPNPTVGSGGV